MKKIIRHYIEKAVGLIFLFITFSSSAQQQIKFDWSISPSDSMLYGNKTHIREMVLDTAENIVVGGDFYGHDDFNFYPNETILYSKGLDNLFFGKYSVNGDLIFAHQIGGPNQEVYGGIACDHNNNILLCGSFSDSIDIDPSNSDLFLHAIDGQDIFIAKYDPLGNLLWGKAIGGLGEDIGSAVSFDSIGNIYISGSFKNEIDLDPNGGGVLFDANNSFDSYIIKLNKDGNYLWSKVVQSQSGAYIKDVEVDLNQNIVAVGYFGSNLTVEFPEDTLTYSSSGANDFFTIKIDSTGTMEWLNVCGGSGGEEVWGMTIGPANNILVCGRFGFLNNSCDFDPSPGNYMLTATSGSSNYNGFIANYSDSGTIIWAKPLFGTENTCRRVDYDTDGNIHCTGTFAGTNYFDPGNMLNSMTSAGQHDVFYCKYSPTCDFISKNRVSNNGPMAHGDVTCTSGGNVYFSSYHRYTIDGDFGSGYLGLAAPGTSTKSFLGYYTNNAGLHWAKQLGVSSPEEYKQSIRDFVIDDGGNKYVLGSFSGTIDFDPSGSTFNLTASNDSTIFLAKYTNYGTFEWAFALHSSSGGTIEGWSIDLDSVNNIYISGSYNGTPDLDPSANIATLTHVPEMLPTDEYLVSYTKDGNFRWGEVIAAQGSHSRLLINSNQEIIVVGSFSGTNDFDPGTGTFNLTPTSTNHFIAKYDTLGAFIDANSSNNILNTEGLIRDSLNNYYCFGWTNYNLEIPPGTIIPTYGGGDGVILKYDSSLNLIEGVLIGDSNYDRINDLTISDNGKLYAIGTFNNSLYPDPSNLGISFTSQGNSDICVLKYTDSLTYMNGIVFGGEGAERGEGIVLNPLEELFITGSYEDTLDLAPANPSLGVLYSKSQSDGFFAKMDSNYVYEQHINLPGNLNNSATLIETWTANRIDICGLFDDNLYPDNEDSSFVQQSNNSTDCFIASYYTCYDSDTSVYISTCDYYITPSGDSLFSSGIFTDIIPNSAGCDSLIEITLTINNDLIIDTISDCGDYIWAITGLNYDSTGVYEAYFVNVNGCDSIHRLVYTNNTITTLLPVTVCDSFTTITGHVYYNDGIYYDTLVGQEGCDSIIEYNLNVLNTDTLITISSCSFYNSPNGSIYYTSGIYFDTIASTFGCDSIIEINLNINLPVNITDTIIQCGSYYWPVNNTTYTTSTNTTVLFFTSAGCDSIRSLVYTNLESDTTLYINTCNSYTTPQGNTYSSTGIYPEIIVNSNNCDSTINYNITILPETNTVNQVTYCGPYFWPETNQTYTSSGTYLSTNTGANGCDSIIQLELLIPTFDTTITTNLPLLLSNENGSSYQWVDCDNNMTIIPGATSPLFTVSANGNYAVILTKNGCIDTSECVTVASIGLAKNEISNEVYIYPNPSTGDFNIDLGELLDVTIKVYSASGKIVYWEDAVNNPIHKISIDASPGIYFMKISNSDISRTFKLLLEERE